MDFGAHITRASNLPVVEYRQKKLALKTSVRAAKGGYEDRWTEWATFGVDLATIRQGWRWYEKGAGRVTLTSPLGTPKPEQPADKGASGVIVVAVANETGLAELEIADTDMVAALKPLFQDYRDSDEMDKGFIPIVRFVAGVNPKFIITDWAERDPDFWGAL